MLCEYSATFRLFVGDKQWNQSGKFSYLQWHRQCRWIPKEDKRNVYIHFDIHYSDYVRTQSIPSKIDLDFRLSRVYAARRLAAQWVTRNGSLNPPRKLWGKLCKTLPKKRNVCSGDFVVGETLVRKVDLYWCLIWLSSKLIQILLKCKCKFFYCYCTSCRMGSLTEKIQTNELEWNTTLLQLKKRISNRY